MRDHVSMRTRSNNPKRDHTRPGQGAVTRQRVERGRKDHSRASFTYRFDFPGGSLTCGNVWEVGGGSRGWP